MLVAAGAEVLEEAFACTRRPLLAGMGSMTTAATSSPCSAKMWSTIASSSNEATTVVATVDSGIPGLLAMPKVANPLPALTISASTWPW